jgi:hypothetical protein
MMRSFKTSGSLTCSAEPSEGPDGSDTGPFPEVSVITTILGGRPLEGRSHMSSPGPRISTRGGWGRGGLKGVMAQALHPTQIKM